MYLHGLAPRVGGQAFQACDVPALALMQRWKRCSTQKQVLRRSGFSRLILLRSIHPLRECSTWNISPICTGKGRVPLRLALG